MKPKEFDIDPANVDTNGLCAAITGAGPWTIADAEFVANSSGDSLAHRLNLTSAAALGAITITLVGTDADGKALTEAILGPASNTIETTGYFLTLTSVTASATLGANTMDIGWVDEVMTKTIPIDYRNQNAATYAVDVTGTINYTVQESFENIQQVELPAQSASWHNVTALAAKTADLASSGTENASACRLIIGSYTDTAEIQLHVSQR
jgi:threonine dehydrogenase-like Zn-dependent dehydrogenase